MPPGNGCHSCCFSLLSGVLQLHRSSPMFALLLGLLTLLSGCGYRGRPLRPEVSETAILERMMVSEDAVQQLDETVSRSKETPVARSGDHATTVVVPVEQENAPPEVSAFSLADAIGFAWQNSPRLQVA